MARGWESKAVESQIDEASQKQSSSSKAPSSGGEKEARREREVLLLARARVLQQIAASKNERYIEMRRQALSELERKIEHLTNGS